MIRSPTNEVLQKLSLTFNNTRDEDVSFDHPLLRTYSDDMQQKVTAIKSWLLEHCDRDKAKFAIRFLKTLEPKYHAHVFDSFRDGELDGYKRLSMRPGGTARMKQIDLTGKSLLYFSYTMRQPGGSFEIRRDGLHGEVIATARLEKTNDARIAAIPLADAVGIHDPFFRVQ